MQKKVASIIILIVVCLLIAANCTGKNSPLSLDFDINGSITEKQLTSYLSRTMKMSNMLSLQRDDFDAHLRLARNSGAKLLQRAVVLWGEEDHFIADLPAVKAYIDRAHALDDQRIFQGTIFEFITSDIEKIPIPATVFTAFGLPVEDRNFIFQDMLNMNCYDPQQSDAGVPDLNRLEARLWYYYIATLYIDIGCEAIHLGQIDWVTENDIDNRKTWELVSIIRDYASEHARRGIVLLDGHTHGIAYGDQLLLDFHSYPLRLKFTAEDNAIIDEHFYDSIYNKSMGGITPSAWETGSLPNVVVFDHGYSLGSRAANTSPQFGDGFDEIT